MIYTIGSTESYNNAIAANGLGKNLKLGRRWSDDPELEQENYIGGIVFESAQSAQAYLATIPDLAPMMSVWKVDADWTTETYLGEDGYHHLLVDALFFPLTMADAEIEPYTHGFYRRRA